MFPVSLGAAEWYAPPQNPAIVAMPHMTQRNRKLIGILFLLGSIIAWLWIGTAIYLQLPPELPWWVLIPYFLVVGVGWTFPAMMIIGWMAKPDRP